MSRYKVWNAEPSVEGVSDGIWTLYFEEASDKLVPICSTESKEWADKIASAMRWVDELESGVFRQGTRNKAIKAAVKKEVVK